MAPSTSRAPVEVLSVGKIKEEGEEEGRGWRREGVGGRERARVRGERGTRGRLYVGEKEGGLVVGCGFGQGREGSTPPA